MDTMVFDLDAALLHHFRYPEFRPGQREALDHALAGHDTLVVMPTGSGKSLIYQLAALSRSGTGLVISPLVALMKDQVDGLTRRGISATFINSSLTSGEYSRRMNGLANGEYKLVLVAPERFRSPAFREALSRITINLFAVDEAHCLSQWGHDFRPDYLGLAQARALLKPPVTLALTATATPRVQDDIVDLLGMDTDAARVITGFNRPNLFWKVVTARTNERKFTLLAQYLEGAEGAGLIYCGTRRETEAVAAYIRDDLKHPVDHYHAGLLAVERTRVQDAFLSGDLPLVVATNAFGMGIDRPDVRFVIHFTVPGSLEAYYQEAGRAGRDGLPADAILFYAAKDAGLHEGLIRSDTPDSAAIRSVHDFLKGQSASVTLAEIEAATGLSSTQLRVALEQLEVSDAIVRDHESYDRIRVEVRPLTAAALRQLEADNERRRRYKLDLLSRMLDYAQTVECRRQVLLRHFGDHYTPGDLPLEQCCDVCAARAAGQPIAVPAQAEAPAGELSRAERAALVVLDAVTKLGLQNLQIGRGKLAQFLKGSESEGIAWLKGRSYFGKFESLRVKEIEDVIDQLLDSGYLRQTGGLRPVLVLSAQGQHALTNRLAIAIDLRPQKVEAERRIKAERQAREAGGTVNATLDLHKRGVAPDQIAAQRGLTESTVYSHLALLIADGRVEVNDVVPVDVQTRIMAAIEAIGSAQYLSPIKAQLGDAISYNEIRCVAEAWKRRKAG
jgi:ATP-dependent DNA helicase RecQ